MNMLRGLSSLFLKLVWPILIIIRWIWDACVNTLMRMTIGLRKKYSLPPVFNPLLLLPATDIAENIRQRKVTSVEVVRAFVTRCSDVNPILNAIVQENFQEALQEARIIDERIKTGYEDNSLTPEILQKEEPFLGVPFTVKETISVEGFLHTAGLLVRADERAHEDAVIVRRMRKAGGILLATTNVPELGMWWECSNPLYGRTNNPYDTRRTPGGSSGGEAALMCSCGSPLSIGTDTGGSIRTPAFFCGLFGHKPTSGLVPLEGCNIHSNGGTNIAVQVAGPITRHAKDLTPVLKILIGEKACKLELDKMVHIGCLKIYAMENDGNQVTTSSVVEPLRKIQREVAKHFLLKYDLDVMKVKIPDLQSSYWIWQEKMAEDFPANRPIFEQLEDNQGQVNIWTEVMRGILGRARHSYASLLQVAMAKVVEEVNFLLAQKQVLVGETPHRNSSPSPGWRQLKMKLQRLLGEDGILFYPSHPTLAPYHRESYFKPLNFVYTAVFNALGFPVTQVPLGIEPESGLPLGIQIVGGMYMDRLTIAVAKELEVAFGGWKCPAKIL